MARITDHSKISTLTPSSETLAWLIEHKIRATTLKKVPWILSMLAGAPGNSDNEKIFRIAYPSYDNSCLHCGNKTDFYHAELLRGYQTFCNCSCRAKHFESYKNGLLETEGNSNRGKKIQEKYWSLPEQKRKQIHNKRLDTISARFSNNEMGLLIAKGLLSETAYDLLYGEHACEFLYFERIVKKLSVKSIAKNLGCGVNSVINALRKFNLHDKRKTMSNIEYIIKQFLDEMCIEYTTNDKCVISPYEIDFYSVNAGVAIEVCGLYYHSIDNEYVSESRRKKDYHYQKYKLCHNKGIKLLTIFEDEILTTPDIVKNRLLHAFGKTHVTTYARKCDVVKLENSAAKKFLDDKHSQKAKMGKTAIGLVSNLRLVAVATFGNSRYEKGATELLRFATEGHVPGALSKLLHHSGYNHVISYSDNRWGDGSGYSKSGFTKIEETPPSYFYFKENTKRHHRSQFMKHKLVADGFDSNMTEVEIMLSRGYKRIFDCGTTKWEWKRK